MKPVECYKTYQALKLHFGTDRYDFFKYNGKTNCSLDSFEKRNDKYFFHRLCKIYDDEQIVQFFVANFVNSTSSWIGDMVSEKGREVYSKHRKIQESLKYSFREDASKIKQYMEMNRKTFDDLFIVEDDQYPIILKMALQSEILLETFIILNKILGFVGRWTEISDTVIWPIYKRKALKYSAFFANMNISEYKDILRSLFVV